jgi:xanthine dehydrogenase YagR molybdenum-binding subunit
MSDWPKQLEYLSKPFDRIDGPAKVTGAAKYPSDMQPQGWLHGMILRSRWASAKISAIDLDKARAVPGIKAAILAEDVPRTVRYYGQELAAVCGTSKQACLDALRAIVVTAEPLPFVVEESVAVKPDSPKVFEGESNVSQPQSKEEGKPDEAFAAADTIVVEGHFRTPVQIHQPLETHGMTVGYEGETLTSWASTQGISSVRDGLADNLGLPRSSVRVIGTYMGGGFGAKFGPGVEGTLAAKLATEAGAPVRMMLTRFDESLAVGNRPSSLQKIRLAAARDGMLTGFDLESYGTAGFAAGGSTAGGGGGAGFPAPYIYKVPNIRVNQRSVAVNAGSSRAFRAPGHPQSSFGMEGIMDELALKLGMDPVELRIKNDPFEIRREQYRIAAEKFGWKEKYRAPGSSPGPVKTGVGCAGATWGGGGRGTRAQVEINPDGTVELRCGTQDLGTGTRTLMAMIAGEVFGIDPASVRSLLGDTAFPPSGGSGGSSTAASVSPAIFDTCEKALEELKKASGMDDVRGANWKAVCAKLGVNPLVTDGAWREGLSSRGAGGVQMAEVSVDTDTGFVRVQRIVCVQDGGLIVNPLTMTSQVNGGIIIGIGYALYEERVMDPLTGMMLNPNFETYKLPGISDIPEIEVVLMNMPERGVIGIGEPVTIPTASAVANAVANAIGVRVPRIPITPMRVLEALGKTPGSNSTIDAGDFAWFESERSEALA